MKLHISILGLPTYIKSNFFFDRAQLFSRESVQKVPKSTISEKQGSNVQNFIKIGVDVYFDHRNSAQKDKNDRNIFCRQNDVNFFDETSFPTLFYKNGSAGPIYLKIGRIVDFYVKTLEKSFRPVGKFLTKI